MAREPLPLRVLRASSTEVGDAARSRAKAVGRRNATGWIRLESSLWAELVTALPLPWPEAAVVVDLRWWADMERFNVGRRPSRRTLAARYGWTDHAVRRLLQRPELWQDPKFAVPSEPARMDARSESAARDERADGVAQIPPNGHQEVTRQHKDEPAQFGEKRQNDASAAPSNRLTGVDLTIHDPRSTMSKRASRRAALLAPPDEEERAAWEHAVGAWAEIDPKDAPRLAIDDNADGALLLTAMRRDGSELVIARLRQAARGSCWHARAARGLTGGTPIQCIGELLRGGKMAEALDEAARRAPDARPTEPGWRDRPGRSFGPSAPVRAPEGREESLTIQTPAEHCERWARALERLGRHPDAESMQSWVTKGVLVGVDDSVATVWFAGDYYATYCGQHFEEPLAKALEVQRVRFVYGDPRHWPSN